MKRRARAIRAITRRDFLKLGGTGSLALWLAACGVSPPDPTIAPTKTPFEPGARFTPTAGPRLTDSPVPTDTARPSPTATRSPTPTETPTSSPTATDSATPTQRPSLASQTGGLLGLAREASLTLGVELNRRLAADPPPAYIEAVTTNFELGVIDGGLYWGSMEPVKGSPNFAAVDQQVSLLTGRGFRSVGRLRGHPLYYPSTNPEWLYASDLTARELVGILERRVTAVMQRYRGSIQEWVVVNQPFFRGKRERKGADIMYRRVGEGYIDIAFEVARKTDPSAVLLFNDLDNHLPGAAGTENSLETVQRLKSKGLVDGVGLQMHLNAVDPPTTDELIRAIRDYPLPVYVTELDVDLSGVSPKRENRLQLQADIFGRVLLACLKSSNCNSVSVWGIGDKYSWLATSLGKPHSDGTLFDDNFEPKPAYAAWRDVLRKWVGSS
jgi:endo-1,4-beta-xylanase